MKSSIGDPTKLPHPNLFLKLYVAAPDEDCTRLQKLQITWESIMFLRTARNRPLYIDLSQGRVVWLLQAFPLLKQLRISGVEVGHSMSTGDVRDRGFIRRLQRACDEKGCVLTILKLKE